MQPCMTDDAVLLGNEAGDCSPILPGSASSAACCPTLTLAFVHTAQAATPVLITHGDADTRVARADVEMTVAKLNEHKGEPVLE